MLILVKHALPVLEADVPPREWRLGDEGEAQSRRLASSLKKFLPFALVASPEPKARRTAQIIAEELGVPLRIVDGLEEFDRPALPLVSRDEHERLNAQIFAMPAKPVLGRESAEQALDRFGRALARAAADVDDFGTLVVIAHGTVIALYVARVRGDDPFVLWKSLDCGSFLVLP